MGTASRLAIASGGGLPSTLPALTSGDADPAWSNNDAKLVFTGDLTAFGTGLGRIYTVAPDGSQLRRLTSTRDSREPRWSPNGRYIAFLRYAGRRADLWIMRADGRHAHRLVQDVGNPVFPSQSSSASWSPRSTAIAFGHRGAVYTIGPDGRHLRRVTPSRIFAAASTPAWSPNGMRIAFVGVRRPSASNSPAIWTIDPSGSHPHRLRYLDESGEDWSLFALDWQPIP
jgi:Tol biopolymer transport system component